jgi:hypothetical protein
MVIAQKEEVIIWVIMIDIAALLHQLLQIPKVIIAKVVINPIALNQLIKVMKKMLHIILRII